MCEKSCCPLTPVAELVVAAALVVVGEDFVRLGAFLELQLGLGLASPLLRSG